MKDAKGHGSEKHGGIFDRDAARQFAQRIGSGPSHQAGIATVGRFDINHPAYNTQQKMPGWTRQVTPLNADYSGSGRMLRQRMSDITKDQHLAAGDAHAQQAAQMNSAHGAASDKASARLGNKDPGPLISGIVSDKFSPQEKDTLRGLAQGSSQHTSAAFAHYAAAGIRLPTARARYQKIRGY